MGERERKSERAREIGTHTERILFGLCVRQREIACAKKRLRERKTERERKKEREYDRKSVIQGHTQKETGFVCWSSDTDRKEYTQKLDKGQKKDWGNSMDRARGITGDNDTQRRGACETRIESDDMQERSQDITCSTERRRSAQR